MIDFNPSAILETLSRYGARAIVAGGIAATLHGSRHVTFDLDVICDPATDNLELVAAALTSLNARITGSPNPPRPIEAALLTGMKIVAFDTVWGQVDLLFEPIGGATYETVLPNAIAAELEGHEVRMVSRADLIAMKRAAGRPKDIATADELEALAILEEVEGPPA